MSVVCDTDVVGEVAPVIVKLGLTSGHEMSGIKCFSLCPPGEVRFAWRTSTCE